MYRLKYHETKMNITNISQYDMEPYCLLYT